MATLLHEAHMKTPATLPRAHKLSALSNPQLVLVIRRLTNENAAWRLKHNGEDPPTGPLFRAAIDEANRRNLQINHPEFTT